MLWLPNSKILLIHGHQTHTVAFSRKDIEVSIEERELKCDEMNIRAGKRRSEWIQGQDGQKPGGKKNTDCIQRKVKCTGQPEKSTQSDEGWVAKTKLHLEDVKGRKTRCHTQVKRIEKLSWKLTQCDWLLWASAIKRQKEAYWLYYHNSFHEFHCQSCYTKFHHMIAMHLSLLLGHKKNPPSPNVKSWPSAAAVWIASVPFVCNRLWAIPQYHFYQEAFFRNIDLSGLLYSISRYFTASLKIVSWRNYHRSKNKTIGILAAGSYNWDCAI